MPIKLQPAEVIGKGYMCPPHKGSKQRLQLQHEWFSARAQHQHPEKQMTVLWAVIARNLDTSLLGRGRQLWRLPQASCQQAAVVQGPLALPQLVLARRLAQPARHIAAFQP